MNEMLKVLVLVANFYTGLKIPDNIDLHVQVISAAEMEKKVCGGIGKCDGKSTGAYIDGSNVIYVSSLCKNWQNSNACKGLIIHESVHYLQYVNGKNNHYGNKNFCKILNRNEREAFNAQRNFLLSKKETVDWTIDSAMTSYKC